MPTTALRSLLALLVVTWAAPASAAGTPSVDDALDAVAAYAPQRDGRNKARPGSRSRSPTARIRLRIITLGFANRDAKIAVTPQTRFAIGSITKSMTALALLQLHDAGRFDLNAPAKRYLPWFSIETRRCSRCSCTSCSRIPAAFPTITPSETGYGYDIGALRKAHVLFTPGTAWSYSNDGYATAGAILAQLDRRTWADSLTARVLSPIGMSQSSPVFTPEVMARRRDRLSVSRRRSAGAAAPCARCLALDGFCGPGGLGSLVARGYGALYALLSQRRQNGRTARSSSRRQRLRR